MALTTNKTTAELEARDTTIHPLSFRITPQELDGFYEVGDSLVINAADGNTFVGHIEDIEEDHLRIYVELD